MLHAGEQPYPIPAYAALGRAGNGEYIHTYEFEHTYGKEITLKSKGYTPFAIGSDELEDDIELLKSKWMSFDGWTTKESEATAFDNSKPEFTHTAKYKYFLEDVDSATIQDDGSSVVHLYARFRPITLNMTLKPAGGLVKDESTVKTTVVRQYNYLNLDTLPLALADVTKDGYDFKGWYTKASGGVRVTARDLRINFGFYKTLYAQWSPWTYPVKLNAGEIGTFKNGANTYYFLHTVGKSTAIKNAPVVSPVFKKYYKFTGWADADGNEYKDGTKYKRFSTVKEGVTLDAQWTAINYKVTLKLNGGKLNDSASTTTVTRTYSIEEPADFMISDADKKEGYTFGGWYTNAKFTGEQVLYGQFMANPGKYKTLYAKWVK